MWHQSLADVLRNASPWQTHVRVENQTNGPVLMHVCRDADNPSAEDSVVHTLPSDTSSGIASGWQAEPRATILMRTGMLTAVKMRVPHGARVVVTLVPTGLEITSPEGDDVELADFPNALSVPGLDTVPMRLKGLSFAKPEAAYLPQFGMHALSDDHWSDQQLKRVCEGNQPQLAVSVTGHEEIAGHTCYALKCTLTRSLGFERAQWQSRKRLAHLRAKLHDPLKNLLGQDEYSKEFGSTPFASRGGMSGTSLKLQAWFQTLVGCINRGQAPPKVVAAVLQFLEAPASDSAIRSLAQACSLDP
jgi:hypothetical protein